MGRRHRRFRIVVASAVAALFFLMTGSAYFWVTERVPSYRIALQSRLSSELGLHVQIGSLDLSWNGLQPRLLIRNVEMRRIDGKEILHLQSVLAAVSWRSLLLGTIRPQSIELTGLHLYCSKELARQWLIAGFSSGAATLPTDWFPALWRMKSITVRQAVISVDGLHRHSKSPWIFHTTLHAVRTHQGIRIQVVATPPPAVAASIRVHLQINGDPGRPRTLSGQWTASVAELRSLPLDAGSDPESSLDFDQGVIHMTGAIKDGRVVRSTLRIRARAIGTHHSGRRLVIARGFNADLYFQRSERGWDLKKFQIENTGVHRRWSAHGNGFCRRLEDDARRCEVDIPHLTLTDVIPWLKLWPRASSLLMMLPSLHGNLGHLKVTADLREDGLSRWHASARLQDVGWKAHGSIPGVDQLSGMAFAQRSGGEIVLTGPAPTFSMPSRFAVPIKFSQLSGVLSWAHHDGQWALHASDLAWKILGLQGRGQVHMNFPASTGPLRHIQLGLNLKFTDRDIARLKPLLPMQWGKNLRNWLQKSVVQARLVAGNAQYEGSLRHFPFGDPKSGRFAMDLQLDEGILQYAAKWPPARHLTASLRFRGNGVEIRSGQGTVGLMAFDHLRGGVADFRDAPALVTLSAQGDAKNVYALLRQSPLQSRLRGLLNRTVANGPVSVNLKVSVPLRHESIITTSGSVQLLGATLGVRGLPFPLTRLQGHIDFNDSSVRATGLKAVAGATVIRGTIAPTSSSPAGVLLLHAKLRAGRSSRILANLLPRWISVRMQGVSAWGMRLPFSGKRAGNLVLKSDLIGTGIALPLPFGKLAAESLPVTVIFDATMSGKPERLTVRSKFFSVVTWLVKSDSQTQGGGVRVDRLGLRIGKGSPPVPLGNEVRISGEMRELDLLRAAAILRSAGVASRMSTHGSLAGTPTEPKVNINLRVDQLSVGQFRLKPVQLRVRLNAIGLHMKVTGPGAEGSLFWGRRKNVLRGRLEHVSLLSPKEGITRLDVGAPHAAYTKTSEQIVLSPVDPSKMPTLDCTFEKVRIGNAPLGRFKILTRRIRQGQKIRTLTISGNQNITLDATGEWLRGAVGSSARITFAFHVNHLARALEAFGYLRNATAASAKISGNLVWPSAESGITLAHAKGRVRLDINNGTLKAVHPGAERVLGLLNLYALPRRLMLNFKDIDDKGLAFDHIGGSFQLGHGYAKTANLTVTGPALRMTIHGSIGLADRDFHETVTVYPNISTGITLGATLLGGPIAGGIALLSQKLFGQQMDSFASFSYRVTGSWDNPVITRVGAVAKKNVQQKQDENIVPGKSTGVPSQ